MNKLYPFNHYRPIPVLPTVYGDALSYGEQVGKIGAKCNEIIEYVNNFDKDLQGYVNEWLDEHPEATTTVENRSLTYIKMKEGVLPYGTPEMYGAVGDGITDDTDAVRQCFNENNIVVLNGDYLVDYKDYEVFEDASHNRYAEYLHLHSNMTIILNGSIICKPNDLYGARLIKGDECDNVTIIGGKYVGDKNLHTGSGIGSNCFTLHGCKNVKITDCRITNFDGDGIMLGYGEHYNSENIFINNCLIDDNGRNNISVVSGVNTVIDNCILADPTKYAPKANIDVEPNDNDHDCAIVNISNVICKGGVNSVLTALYNTYKKSKVLVDGIISDTALNISVTNGKHSVEINGLKYEPSAFWGETRYAILCRCNSDSHCVVNGTINLLDETDGNAWGLVCPTGNMNNCVFDLKTVGNHSYAYDVVPSEYTLANNVIKIASYNSYTPPYIANTESEGIDKIIDFFNKTEMTTNFTISPCGGYFIIDGEFSLYNAGVYELSLVKKGLTLIFDNQRETDVELFGVTLKANSITKLQSFKDESLSVIYQYEY